MLRRIGDWFRIQPVEQEEMEEGSERSNDTDERSTQSSFERPVETKRRIQDVEQTALILFRGSNSRPPLPAEIVTKILDYAEYWTDVAVESTERINGVQWNYPYLKFNFYEAVENPEESLKIYRHVRRLEFEFEAHDQGTV